jgi:glyoxylase-like metal-dependent hydrolase (beta-lactamase superfamily II)
MPVRTPTLPPATHTNSFLIGTGEAVLVEPASPYEDEISRMVEWVDDARAEGVRVAAILATHHHPDHVGGAKQLAERLSLPLWAHEMTEQRLQGVVQFDRLLGEGERIELSGPTPTALTAVHTPGHAPGHLCFIDEATGILIAGDMVASVGTIIVEPVDGDMALYLDSLRRMIALEPAGLLPAHGGVIEGARAMLEFYIEHRLMREAKVFGALQAHGPGRPLDIVAQAYDDAPKAVWPLAVRSIEAHLIKLEREGRVERDPAGWRTT